MSPKVSFPQVLYFNLYEIALVCRMVLTGTWLGYMCIQGTLDSDLLQFYKGRAENVHL